MHWEVIKRGHEYAMYAMQGVCLILHMYLPISYLPHARILWQWCHCEMISSALTYKLFGHVYFTPRRCRSSKFDANESIQFQRLISYAVQSVRLRSGVERETYLN